MIRAALARGIDARLMGGEDLTFQSEFDAVFSNAALHWMKHDPDAVLSGVARSLKPKGRFVGEFGGHGNVASITVALRAALLKRGIECEQFSPWFFPTADEYRDKLERNGFRVERIVLIPRPTLLPTGMEGWLRTFANPFFALCNPDDIPGILADAVALLRQSLQDAKGVWTADYVRLRFAAYKT
jgi:SAM-dependent methyltransferase